MTRVRRYDRQALRTKARKDAGTGFLHVDASLTRAPAVFPYRCADGSIRREYRPADHVFAQANLDSVRHAVVTDEHPPTKVNTANVKRYAVGHGDGNVRTANDHLHNGLIVQDDALIAKMERGDQVQVSLGYDCDLIMRPGIHTDSQGRQWPYDAIQTNHRTNHIAIVQTGRAGSSVRVHMDSTDAVQEDETTMDPSKIENKLTSVDADSARVKVGNIELTLPTAQAQAVATEQARADEAIAVEAKRADEAEGKLTAITKERDDLKTDSDDDAKMHDRVIARVALVTKAQPHFDAKEWPAMATKTDSEIMRAVVGKAHADIDLTDRSDDYVQALFDATKSKAQAKTDSGVQKLGTAVVTTRTDDSADDDRATVQKRIDAIQDRQDQAWRQPVPGGFHRDHGFTIANPTNKGSEQDARN